MPRIEVSQASYPAVRFLPPMEGDATRVFICYMLYMSWFLIGDPPPTPLGTTICFAGDVLDFKQIHPPRALLPVDRETPTSMLFVQLSDETYAVVIHPNNQLVGSPSMLLSDATAVAANEQLLIVAWSHVVQGQLRWYQVKLRDRVDFWAVIQCFHQRAEEVGQDFDPGVMDELATIEHRFDAIMDYGAFEDDWTAFDAVIFVQLVLLVVVTQHTQQPFATRIRASIHEALLVASVVARRVVFRMVVLHLSILAVREAKPTVLS
ncbi:uncharacterized protein B0H18DRAFT_1118155 [Fomitopsis serialis]|uniref:uncharacterized protein n=1 Tax=Fomitopsis serialis TaxID=139415 RepID=UPI002007AB85|nr:uncharacterized protein B0H18DRAFT_1118155 [Neoantrodia serialis]KAH9928136.1 hypothetical protein B0H18DRAFT_1118155 [Neoantrodia serialis]